MSLLSMHGSSVLVIGEYSVGFLSIYIYIYMCVCVCRKAVAFLWPKKSLLGTILKPLENASEAFRISSNQP